MEHVPDRSQMRRTSQALESITRWAPTLWSIRIGRPEHFRFQPGHYAKLGLEVGGEMVWRPYSIVSSPDEAFLEFLVTLVPGGALTSKLAEFTLPAVIALEAAAMGFFLPGQLSAGESLWMLSTGAGLGPYVSMLRDGSTLDHYQRVILVHSVRLADELAYRQELEAFARHDPRFCYVPIVTRQPGVTQFTQRIPELLEQGALVTLSGARFDAETARVMVCGNPSFTADMRQLLNGRGFQPCRRGYVGSMLFENYW